MKKLIILTIILASLFLLLPLVNTYVIDLSSILSGCIYKEFEHDLPLRHTYNLSDIAEAARRNDIEVEVQSITYDHIQEGEPLPPELQQLLGHDGFVAEEIGGGAKRISGNGLFLKFHAGPTYEMLIRYQPDSGYKQAIEMISLEGGCAVPNIRIRARVKYMLNQLGIENDRIDHAQIHVFSNFLHFNLP